MNKGNHPVVVDNYPEGASPHHVLDMAGNVWEWSADWHKEKYYQNSPTRNPTDSESGESRILRGGSWYLNQDGARCAVRDGFIPTDRGSDIGFLVAESVP